MSASTPSARGNIDGAYRRDHERFRFSFYASFDSLREERSCLATKISRGRRGSIDVLLSSPVLCGLSSILKFSHKEQ